MTQYLKLGWDIILTCLGCFNVEDIGHANQYLFLLSLIGENTDLDFEEIIDDFCTFFIAGWYDNNDTLHVRLFCTTYNSKYTVELCLDLKINVLLNPFLMFWEQILGWHSLFITFSTKKGLFVPDFIVSLPRPHCKLINLKKKLSRLCTVYCAVMTINGQF